MTEHVTERFKPKKYRVHPNDAYSRCVFCHKPEIDGAWRGYYFHSECIDKASRAKTDYYGKSTRVSANQAIFNVTIARSTVHDILASYNRSMGSHWTGLLTGFEGAR